jgi:hypothetical protein
MDMTEKRMILHGHSLGTGNERPPLVRLEHRRVFLLSPANSSGVRAQRLLNAESTSSLSQKLRGAGAPLGEVYRFVSSLYFRGKLAYAERFQNPPENVPGVYIITAGAGLMLPGALVTLHDLKKLSAPPLHATNRDYREPLERDLSRLQDRVGDDTQIVLLGSVATPKYVEPLLETFRERLFFPGAFAGRGDMSRGGLLLRCVSTGEELHYLPVAGSERRGTRPAKLAPREKKRGR